MQTTKDHDEAGKCDAREAAAGGAVQKGTLRVKNTRNLIALLGSAMLPVSQRGLRLLEGA